MAIDQGLTFPGTGPGLIPRVLKMLGGDDMVTLGLCAAPGASHGGWWRHGIGGVVIGSVFTELELNSNRFLERGSHFNFPESPGPVSLGSCVIETGQGPRAVRRGFVQATLLGLLFPWI